MSSVLGVVVLLHGIGRSHHIMKPMALALKKIGYSVCNINYPSVRLSISDIAEFVYQKIQHYYNQEQAIHFVGHSMGAIVTRVVIRDYRPNNLGRVVMIAPPNRGSLVVDFLQRFTFFKMGWGPAGQEIGTNHNGIHHQLPPADYECGVIAGNRSMDPWFSWFLYSEPNDGKVAVSHTRLEGMTDFVVVPVAHGLLPKNRGVIELVKSFLRKASFETELLLN